MSDHADMTDGEIVEGWLPKKGCTSTPWEIAKPGDADEAHRALRRIIAERDELARTPDAAMAVGWQLERRKWTRRAETAEEKAARMTDERNDARYALKAAEAERNEAREACEKAIRERRSLEIKEDDWHTAYERSEARVKELRELANEYFRAKYDTSYSPEKDWHKRHDQQKAEQALRAALAPTKEDA